MRRIPLIAAILTLGVVLAVPALGAEGGDSKAPSPVRKQVKYGFIDQTGKMVISPQFDFAKGFSEGKAVVKVGRKWGFIDRSGRLVWKSSDGAEP